MHTESKLKNIIYTPPTFRPVKITASYEMTLPENSFNAYTLSRKYNDIFTDEITDTTWQPDVYRYARQLAGECGITTIVDIGCGNGEKLIEAFDDKDFSITGIDYSTSLEVVQKMYPKKRWLECNLGHAPSIEKAFHGIASNEPCLYVLSDVLEHIVDPRLLLRKLRQLLKLNPNSRLVVSTPDSRRGKSYDPLTKLPINEAHIREWSLNKLVQFFSASGFDIHRAGHTRSNQYDSHCNTCLVVLGATEENHTHLLERYGFPRPKKSVIITTEHADQQVTGGIGSYIKEVEAITAEEKPIVFYCGQEAFESTMITRRKSENILDIRAVNSELSVALSSEWQSLSVSVYTAMLSFLYHYDQIRVIEYQEYLGVGASLAEAKRSGEIPHNTALFVRCHGSLVYTDRAAQIWSGMDIAEIFELERLSIRYADKVAFATNYLRKLYESTGYELPQALSPQERQPYPYDYPEIPKRAYQKITNLVFLGKRWSMKGYEDFCFMAAEITNPKSKYYRPQIKKITVIGKGIPGYEHLDKKLRVSLRKNGVSLKIGGLSHKQVLKTVNEIASFSLFCLPYNGDNHPVTVLEMMAQRCMFLAYNRGGIPELIPKRFHTDFLCESGEQELTKQVSLRLKNNPSRYAALVESLHAVVVKKQHAANKRAIVLYTKPANDAVLQKPPLPVRLATIVIPVYNTEFEYIKQLFLSLNQQSYPPAEVLIVNDATPGKLYAKKLEKLARENLGLPFRIITHKQNLGLAGARNTALEACKTKYLINIDSDDVVSNDFVYDYVNLLESNPEYSVAICALESFTDKKGVSLHTDRGFRYVGLGDCYILGLTKNILGHSGSCVVVTDAKNIGGWDMSDKSKWEDWAFYLKLTAAGKKIINFPKINYFYRNLPNSMVKTYPQYPAQLRLTRSITGFSRWESLRLYAYTNNPKVIFRERQAEAQPTDPSFADSVVSESRSFFHRHPLQRKTVKASLVAALRLKNVSRTKSRY